ncbi:hypothetical protein [Chitinilyticum litopenaei]|uniref:hypothetical protein n=1 Tax=Chitinilyticum litopenaei TaxID=1121276 RepID=UPI0004910C70|nr:hypothetical protein [Chitinilyticum litopenaei]
MMNSKQALANEMARLGKRCGRKLGVELGKDLLGFAHIDLDMARKQDELEVAAAMAFGRGVIEGCLFQLTGAEISEQEIGLVLNRLHAMVLQAVATAGGAQ